MMISMGPLVVVPSLATRQRDIQCMPKSFRTKHVVVRISFGFYACITCGADEGHKTKNLCCDLHSSSNAHFGLLDFSKIIIIENSSVSFVLAKNGKRSWIDTVDALLGLCITRIEK